MVEIVRVLSTFPAVEDLLRAIRVRKPHFLFLCVDDFSSAEALALQLDTFLPGFPVVGLSRHLELDMLSKLMHLGIREYLTSPISPARFAEVVNSTQGYLKTHPAQVVQLADVYTFLPVKPGVGCSTITISTSCALAEDLGARTLLMDCDLAAGAIKFLLKMGNSSSIVDAIGHAGSLDEDLWPQLVGHWDKLDVLHAGELTPPPSVDLASLQTVLSVARSQYEVICVDLASSLDQFSVDLMRESRRIFVVTTPEVAPLHLAEQRIHFLKDIGLGDRISVLLNRKAGGWRNLPDAEVVQSVGSPLAFTFSNDYLGVEKAILMGRPISQESKLGQCILNLARSLMPHLEPKKTSKQRKFLEFFCIPREGEIEEKWHD